MQCVRNLLHFLFVESILTKSVRLRRFLFCKESSLFNESSRCNLNKLSLFKESVLRIESVIFFFKSLSFNKESFKGGKSFLLCGFINSCSSGLNFDESCSGEIFSVESVFSWWIFSKNFAVESVVIVSCTFSFSEIFTFTALSL